MVLLLTWYISDGCKTLCFMPYRVSQEPAFCPVPSADRRGAAGTDIFYKIFLPSIIKQRIARLCNSKVT